MTEPIEIYSRQQVAQMFGISLRMVDKLRAKGELTPTRIGRRTVYRCSVLERYLDRKTRSR